MKNQQTAPPVTIASVRAHGVRRLVVYCHGKRPDYWPCHHRAELPVDRFRDDDGIKEHRGKLQHR